MRRGDSGQPSLVIVQYAEGNTKVIHYSKGIDVCKQERCASFEDAQKLAELWSVELGLEIETEQRS